MNFEIKSTFINIRRRLSQWPHTAWILFVNLLLSGSAAWAYFDNLILPATIGSRYYGQYYVSALETIAHLVAASTLYALTTLAAQRVARWLHRYKTSRSGRCRYNISINGSPRRRYPITALRGNTFHRAKDHRTPPSHVTNKLF